MIIRAIFFIFLTTLMLSANTKEYYIELTPESKNKKYDSLHDKLIKLW